MSRCRILTTAIHEACDQQSFGRLGMNVDELVHGPNRKWKLGKEQASSLTGGSQNENLGKTISQVRIISRKTIRDFCQRFPAAEEGLDVWYRNVLDADWNSIVDVRRVYPHADAVGRCTVFNIRGNHYRLIARINYKHRTVYIRGIYTHKEYDEGGWKYGCEGF